MPDATPSGVCIGHLDTNGFEAEMRRLAASGQPARARRSQMSGERMSKLVQGLRGGSGNLSRSIDVRGAHIDGDVELTDLRLTVPLQLAGAHITGSLSVRGIGGLDYLRLGAPAEGRTRYLQEPQASSSRDPRSRAPTASR